MPNDLVRDTTVADDANGDAFVLDDADVVATQNGLAEGLGTVLGDTILGLVTGTASSLNTFEDVVGVDGSQYGEAWFNE